MVFDSTPTETEAAVLWAITATMRGMDAQEAVEKAAGIYQVDPVAVHEQFEEIIDLYQEGYEPIAGRK